MNCKCRVFTGFSGESQFIFPFGHLKCHEMRTQLLNLSALTNLSLQENIPRLYAWHSFGNPLPPMLNIYNVSTRALINCTNNTEFLQSYSTNTPTFPLLMLYCDKLNIKYSDTSSILLPTHKCVTFISSHKPIFILIFQSQYYTHTTGKTSYLKFYTLYCDTISHALPTL